LHWPQRRQSQKVRR